MGNQKITVLFPTPDYAVIAVNDQPVKSLSADNRPDVDKAAARAALALEAKTYCKGLEDGFHLAIRTLQNMTLDLRTHL
jgi:hypothetical protein